MRNTYHPWSAALLATFLVVPSAMAVPAADVEKAFVNPPEAPKPGVLWMGCNLSKAEIISWTEPWWLMVCHAALESKRHVNPHHSFVRHRHHDSNLQITGDDGCWRFDPISVIDENRRFSSELGLKGSLVTASIFTSNQRERIA